MYSILIKVNWYDGACLAYNDVLEELPILGRCVMGSVKIHIATDIKYVASLRI